jgi:hypothetical protein
LNQSAVADRLHIGSVGVDQPYALRKARFIELERHSVSLRAELGLQGVGRQKLGVATVGLTGVDSPRRNLVVFVPIVGGIGDAIALGAPTRRIHPTALRAYGVENLTAFSVDHNNLSADFGSDTFAVGRPTGPPVGVLPGFRFGCKRLPND